MNRSILIVICDFLVSSMLSMMTGMVPANSSGNGIGLDADSTRALIVELEQSRSEILQLRAALRTKIERDGITAENQKKMDALNHQLAINELELEKVRELGKSTPENTGVLTREELAKRLEAEKLRRIEAEIRDSEKKESIAMVREMLKDSQHSLKEARESETKLRSDVERMNTSLAQTAQENAKKSEELAESRAELTQTKTTLGHTQQALQAMQGQVQLTIRRSTQTEQELNRLRGQNAVTSRELAEMKDKVGALERELAKQNVLRREAEVARANLEQLSRLAAVELAEKGAAEKKAQADLVIVRKKLVESKAAEKAVKEQLDFLRKQTGTDLFEHYQSSVLKLGIEIGEKRVIGNLDRTSVHYLPLVRIGDKHYLIGALSMFAGGEGEPFHFQKVEKLAFHLSDGKSAPVQVLVPLAVSKREPYLAAFELAAIPGVKPLDVVPVEKLRQRGVQRLTLFKTASCGKDSAPLGDRCSLDLQPEGAALIIRNNARNANEIKALVGDFVLTNDGDFVGVVVSIADAGRYQEARVALGSSAAWENAEKIQVTPDVTDHLYHAFGDYMKSHIRR